MKNVREIKRPDFWIGFRGVLTPSLIAGPYNGYRQLPRKPRLVSGDESAQSKNNKINFRDVPRYARGASQYYPMRVLMVGTWSGFLFFD